MLTMVPADRPDDAALLREGVCAWRLDAAFGAALAGPAAAWTLAEAATGALLDADALPILNRRHRPEVGAPALLPAAAARAWPGAATEFLLLAFCGADGPALEVAQNGVLRRLAAAPGVVALIWTADPRVSWRLDGATGKVALAPVALRRFDAARVAAAPLRRPPALRLEQFA